jgi:predicted AAA+ superfamily ATPase
LRGTLPELALQPSTAVRRRWLDGYVDQLLLRDAALADEHRDPVRLRRYLTALASNTAGLVEHKALFDAAGVVRGTAQVYDSLLELLFVSERVPAWHTNRLNRLSRSPKRYLTEPAMVGSLLGVDERAVLRNGDLLGRLVDTFVVSQLRPEAEAAATPVRLFHLRLDGGRHECDLLAERVDGRVVAFEMKAASAPRASDAVHLAWLRDELGEQFAGGVLFHTGPRTFVLDEGIVALPICCLWGSLRAAR